MPSSADEVVERVHALKTEQPDLRLVILDTLEMILGDEKSVISEGLRKLKLLADDLNVAIVIGSSSNMKFKQHKRNPFERYADVLLILRKNEQDYMSEIITHEENDAQYDYDDKLRGLVKVDSGSTILVKYPVEIQIRNKEGLLGSAILQYMPQKGVFLNGK